MTADAEVYGLQTSVAFYLGPDKQPDSEDGQTSGETKYGFFFGIYVDSVDLGNLVPGLPDFLDITLPETIFYVSSLEFDADIGGFPDPDLFRFINEIYGTTEDPGAKITLEAGAGLLTNVCAPPIPEGLQHRLEEALWMDFSGCLLFQGNVPLFGKTGISLSLYLPEITPKESDKAPEWFERALLHLSVEVDVTEVKFGAAGELDTNWTFGSANPAPPSQLTSTQSITTTTITSSSRRQARSRSRRRRPPLTSPSRGSLRRLTDGTRWDGRR
ncbi:MAG: hypothetical protein AMJ77_02825 [Dehalococcoidia bacterium SM23_28_2]|nr:MAG: hypothetical protein AMJ77_02825 [Dehalococcoidia bacterium SM23_28_2]